MSLLGADFESDFFCDFWEQPQDLLAFDYPYLNFSGQSYTLEEEESKAKEEVKQHAASNSADDNAHAVQISIRTSQSLMKPQAKVEDSTDEEEAFKPARPLRKKTKKLQEFENLTDRQIEAEINSIDSALEATAKEMDLLKKRYELIKTNNKDGKLTKQQQEKHRQESNVYSARNTRAYARKEQLESILDFRYLERRNAFLEETNKKQQEEIKELKLKLEASQATPQVTTEVAVRLSSPLKKSTSGVFFRYDATTTAEPAPQDTQAKTQNYAFGEKVRF